MVKRTNKIKGEKLNRMMFLIHNNPHNRIILYINNMVKKEEN